MKLIPIKEKVICCDADEGQPFASSGPSVYTYDGSSIGDFDLFFLTFKNKA
ncbi:MAG: hypothetical protein FWF91_01345 [Coriobacteriia bacterium]|nr:hypothetical protein [Coriobacteriia bacterium]